MSEIDAVTEYEALGFTGYPVALFWGQEHQTVIYVDIESDRRAIPDLEFHSVNKAIHLFHYERPEVVNPLLIEFLRSSPGC